MACKFWSAKRIHKHSGSHVQEIRLSLVGKTAAESCTSAVSFFDFLQQIYAFFTTKTNHYDVPYILAYKSKNFGQIFALKVGGSTYRRVIKFFFCRSDELLTPK